MTLLTDELRSHIGREALYPAREEMGRGTIRYFVLALRDDNPLFLDDDYARSNGYPSLIAPPTLVCDICQYAHQPPEERGYFGHSWKLPVPDLRVVRVSNEYEFFRPVLPSDRISVRWKLEDIVERSSSRGGTQLFVYSLAQYFAGEEIVASNREISAFQPRNPR